MANWKDEENWIDEEKPQDEFELWMEQEKMWIDDRRRSGPVATISVSVLRVGSQKDLSPKLLGDNDS